MESYSVLMSVYAKENPDYLKTSMDSIWNQTLKTDDFVLVCDGPLTSELDEVIAMMEEAHKDVLHVIRLPQNIGLGNALNEGLQYCRNEFVARMDSDDICCLNRCELQSIHMSEDAQLGICSGIVIEFVGTIDNSVGKRVLPKTDEEIREFSKKRNPFNHPAVMFRKSAVMKAGGYDEKYPLFEDYYLWVRMLQKGIKGKNLNVELLYMRAPKDLYRRRGGTEYTKNMLRFHRWLRQSGWSSMVDYITGALPHAAVCVLPNGLRKIVYNVLHR